VGRRAGGSARYLGLLTSLVLLAHCGVSTEEGASAVDAPRLQEASVVATLATTHTFTPIADARVEEPYPALNFGFAGLLGADLSPREESYLRFSLFGLKGTVTRATLRLYASDGTSAGPQVFSVAARWWEEGLTWSSRPARSTTPVASTGAIPAGAWVEYDVTAAIHGNGEWGFALVPTSSDGVDFASRESVRTELRPRLVVTVTPEPAPPTGCMLRTDIHYRSTSSYVDGFVSEAEPTRNFSAEPQLRVDGAPLLESYVRFEVETEGFAVRKAWLELDVTDPTSNGPKLFRARSNWSEESLTWNTLPGLGESPIGNLGALSANTRVSYDLTGVVTDQGAYSFALLPESSDGTVFSSSDAGWPSRGPYLFYTLESPTYCSYRGTGGGLTEWVRQYGGMGAEHLAALAPHPEGGFLAVGRFGEASFPAEEGLALARYSATGAPLWSRVVATGNVRPMHVTLTPQGHILVAGLYQGSPNLGTGSLPFVPGDTWGGLFIARFSPSGQSLWARGFTARNQQGEVLGASASAVASDGSGNVLVTGSFRGWMNLGGETLASNVTGNVGTGWGSGGFVAKFGPEGQHLWSRAFQSGDQDPSDTWPRGDGVSADAAGNVLVGGAAGAWTNLGDGPLGQRAPFIAKYSPTGALLWKRVFQGAYGHVADVKPQGAHRIGFIGNFGDTFTFAGRSYFGGDPSDGYRLPPNTNGFLGTLTDTGADVWLSSIGTGTGFILSFQTVAVSEDGAFTVSGTGQEAFDVGGGSMGFWMGFTPYWSTRRTFVARYSPSGQHVWSRTFDLERIVYPALQPGGAVVLGLSLGKEFELEGSTYTPSGRSDLLYLRVVR